MKIVKYTLYGAIIGFLAGFALSLCVGLESIVECGCTWVAAFFGCNGSTCSSGCEKYTNDPDVRRCILYVTIIGTGIGAVYGAVVTLQENNENARKRKQEADQIALASRQNNAVALRNTISDAISEAQNTQKQANGYGIPCSYSANEMQEKGWKALKKAYDLNEELAVFIEEIKKGKS